MNNVICAISILMLLALGTIWILVITNEQTNHNASSFTFATAFLSFIFYITFLSTDSEISAKFFSTLYYSSTIWLLYFVQNFTREYVHVKKLSNTLRFICIALCAIDTVFCIINFFTSTFYSLSYQKFYNTNLYFWNISSKPLFRLHFITGFLLIIHTIILLINKIKKSPSLYKVNYLTFLISYITIIISNCIITITDYPIDISMFLFVFLADSLFLFSSTRGYKKLINQTLHISASNLNTAIITFDEYNEIAFMNEAAFKLFNIPDKNSDKPVKFLKDFIENNKLQQKNTFSLEMNMYFNNENRIFSISYTKLFQNKIHIGTTLTFTDKTDEINEYNIEKYKANHDSLTGLYNREFFYEVANKTLKANPSAKWIMLTSNIKDFKLINETQGDDIADEVLKYTAELISQNAHPDTLYGRIADDHFAVLMKQEDFDEKLFEDSISKISSITDINGYKLQFNIGIYQTDYAMESAMLMVDKANLALLFNTVTPQQLFYEYNNAFMKKLLNEKNILADFNYALRSNQFKLYLQTQNKKDGTVVGAEVLVRWMEPGAKPLLPKDFLPTLEKLGLVYKLDSYILEEAAKILQKWSTNKTKKNYYLCVNISPNDFHYFDIVKELKSLVEKYKISKDMLRLEITEKTFNTDKDERILIINELRKEGFIINLDDFGETDSSFEIFKDLEVDSIKIDISLINKAINAEKETTILKNVAEMSKMIGMQVIAEYIETPKEYEYTSQIKCDLFQGFHYSEPMPVNEFENKY